ncbi:MAG: matrixin family metalloprotease [Proteobacteria bacterium]|nr:matrixin family metalloprotease [Pseudomonadota bacterium]
MQFYKNMRFPDSKISYKIDECPLQKKNNMERTFEILSNLTILEFYSTNTNEEISITCDENNKIEEGLFIAGEGGPINITQTQIFNVIHHGKILLIKDSKCPSPNIAIHELLHVLGFEHSENPDNIMYPVSECEQIIGEDQISLINHLYSTPSYPDLVFENVSAIMHGTYLNADISIRNDGLKNSEKFKIIIYADKKIIKEIEVEALRIGYGTQIKLTNIWIKQLNVNELEFVIEYPFNELEKKNNKKILELKK